MLEETTSSSSSIKTERRKSRSTPKPIPPSPLSPIPILTAYLLLLDFYILLSNLPFSLEGVWEEGLRCKKSEVCVAFILRAIRMTGVCMGWQSAWRELVLGWHLTYYNALSNGTCAIVLPASGLYTATSGLHCWKYNPHLHLPPPPPPSTAPSRFAGPRARG